MWWQIASLAVPVLGVAGAVGWLEFGASRRIKTARAEAELFQLLPPGAAHAALTLKVERDVLSHVHLDMDKKFRNWLRAGHAVLAISALNLAVTVGVFVAAVPDPSKGKTMVIGGCALCAALSLVVLTKIRARLRAIAGQSLEDAGETSPSGVSTGAAD